MQMVRNLSPYTHSGKLGTKIVTLNAGTKEISHHIDH